MGRTEPDRQRPEVAVLVGLPGAGKSTFVKTCLPGDRVVVSKDLMPASAKNKGARQLRLIAAALDEGRSVVVDNTNPASVDRQGILALAREKGARTVAYWFPADVPASLARNARRAGRARVPHVAIFTVKKRLEPPRPEEGFHEVHRVCSEEGFRFEVKPMHVQPKYVERGIAT